MNKAHRTHGLSPFYTESRGPRPVLPALPPDLHAVIEAMEHALGVSLAVACPTGGAL